jgi:hypothetical protein
MKKSTLIKTALIAACLPLFAGCVERQVVYRDRPVYVQPSPAPATEVVVADPAPPPPQVEVIPVAPNPAFWGPRPRPGAVWVRGGWAHRGNGRVWVGAHWR